MAYMYFFKNLCTYVLGIIFIISGLAKFMNIDAFANEVAQYSEIYFGSWLVSARSWIAVSVCMTEIMIGLLAFYKKLDVIIGILFLVAISFFVFLTGANYLFPPSGGSIESCGCFGELLSYTARTSFYKSIILWIISVSNIFVIIYVYKKKKIALCTTCVEK